jgi:ABC-type multidrug transport system ATPase subunit
MEIISFIVSSPFWQFECFSAGTSSTFLALVIFRDQNARRSHYYIYRFCLLAYGIDMTVSTLFSLDNCSVKSGGKTILAPFSLTIDTGEFVTITGPSGAGKTTLLQLLLGFVPPSSGQVLFRGQPLVPSRVKAMRRETAVVFQEPVLNGQTVREFLFHPFSYKQNRAALPSDDRIASELAIVGLGQIDPQGPVKTLSGGEKQRVALVGALLMDRPLLILDEITSALDRSHRQQVQAALFERRATVIAVSHNAGWIKRSPRVLQLQAAEKE